MKLRRVTMETNIGDIPWRVTNTWKQFSVSARWPSGTVPDLRPRGHGFESHPPLLCTNPNSACHPVGVS